MNVEVTLDDLLVRLRSELGVPVTVRRIGGTAHIRIGEDAVMTIAVDDPERPSFTVTYPKLVVRRNHERVVTEAVVYGVLFEGVAWIARQLNEHGVVPQELP
ncbi:MAG: hypothetical protein JW751_25705 [Polyangiaceae bacterium]|nr:hypothetical protein [Polyangiaceae bacterium]